MRYPALMLVLTLTACGQGAPSPGNTGQGSAASGTAAPAKIPGGVAVPTAAALIGEYRVAGIDDAALDTGEGFAVSITETTISFEPRCLGSAWTYTLENGSVSLQRDPRYGPQKAPDGSLVSCLPAVSQTYGVLARNIALVEHAERTPSNGIRLSGGGHSVTLYSQ